MISVMCQTCPKKKFPTREAMIKKSEKSGIVGISHILRNRVVHDCNNRESWNVKIGLHCSTYVVI